MYPFWKTIVEPALVAAGSRRVVEIGALRGETTVRMLDSLGPDSEIHVIDPVPMFDPDEHAKRFPGRYIFYRDISHNVLPELPPMDAALVDGDHNWFTVYHELRMLRETARAAGAALPLLVMHDVCWPYGRRDLYYAPERIPAEGRQPYAEGGLLPGRSELDESGGGLNQHLSNANHEGGERNGVRTALDDFVAEHDRPLRQVILPFYYGLALVVEAERVESHPELGDLLDRLESPAGRLELLELSEAIRIDEQILHHNAHFRTKGVAERVASRYLELLKGAVLDEHYLENELRIEHLIESAETGKDTDPYKLRDPGRYMTVGMERLRQRRAVGEPGDWAPGLPLSAVGRTKLEALEGRLDLIRQEAVAGDLVECGVDRGGVGVFMRGYLDAYDLPPRTVWVANRFDAGSEPDAGEPLFASDLNVVRDAFDRFGLLDEDVFFLQGPPGEQLGAAPIEKVALLHVHGRSPEEVEAILEAVYDRVTAGGFVIVDDYWSEGCREVVDRFRAAHGVADPIERVDWSAACWRKAVRQVDSDEERAGEARPEPAGSAPTRLPAANKDLSVVVIAHDMRREASRTLYSLSSRYQRGLEGLDYEVIVVENGSAPDQRLGEGFVRGLGPEFSYLDLGEESESSPARALNRGILASRGDTVALMIDGAHVLTPGVLRMAMLGQRTYGPAVVAVQQWYVGPGEQNEAIAGGYDEDYEDRLFAQIGWPTDGYKLFDIGHFIGDRDWFDGQWESNCIFVPRALIEQSGMFDESFSMPGGGYVNLDFFERMAATPGVELVTLLGEGSFHQLHGGTTTNVPDLAERSELLSGYAQHYEELRGRRFKAPHADVKYLGSLPDPARRTKARRMGAPDHFKFAHTVGTDGRPPKPVPVPEGLRTEFVDAVWRSDESRSTTWLGRWTGKPPTDLFTLQELVFRVKPDWVIETASGGGGRASFIASVFELLGHGQVLSIDNADVPRLAEHPRITYLRGDPGEEEMAAQAREAVGERPRGLLLLGMAGMRYLMRSFELYSPMVPVGSYVVLESTILNGHPVWTGFGPGPFEAARRITNAGDFVRDAEIERFAFSFNRGGYLKRVKRTEPGS